MLTDLLTLLVCLFVTHGVLLYSDLEYRHPDYFSLALKRRPLSIFAPILIEGVLGSALLLVVEHYLEAPSLRLLTSAVVGIAVALVPEGLGLLLGRIMNERVASSVSSTLSIFMRIVRQNFRRTVHDLRREDCVRYRHNEGEWRCPDTNRRHRTRLLRQLFETHKIEIAAAQRMAALLERDGFPPYQNFYLLVDHLGRHRLRHLLTTRAFESPRAGWDGREERQARGSSKGTAADRRNKVQDEASSIRCYDDDRLRAQIERGEVGPDYQDLGGDR